MSLEIILTMPDLDGQCLGAAKLAESAKFHLHYTEGSFPGSRPGLAPVGRTNTAHRTTTPPGFQRVVSVTHSALFQVVAHLGQRWRARHRKP